ncbi:hypothetical protein [Paramicrobacterium agarici]|uniref:hypothetical protein n=1 Tax=Paramicrobacterium agarici TaxID=630514 RepID=UPI0012DE41B7|nr:hypothetical protein [Microbacterium agarici]
MAQALSCEHAEPRHAVHAEPVALFSANPSRCSRRTRRAVLAGPVALFSPDPLP